MSHDQSLPSDQLRGRMAGAEHERRCATSSRRWRSRAAGRGSGGCWLVLALAALAFWAWRYWQKRRAQAPASCRSSRRTSGPSRSCEEALALIGQPREFCIAGLRHHPLVSGGAVRLPRAGTHHRGVPARTAGDQSADAGPEGQPGRVPRALRPGQVRQIRARPARAARPARLGAAAGGGNASRS